MDWDTLLRRRGTLIALAGLLGADDLDDVALRVAAIDVAGDAGSGRPVPPRLISELLEDLELAIPFDAAVSRLEAAGLISNDGDGTLRVRPRIAPWTRLGSPDMTSDLSVLLEEVTAIAAHGEAPSGVVAFDVAEALRTVRETSAWALEIAASARSAHLDGIPVFWSCDIATKPGHAPFSPDAGLVTTSDAVRLALAPTLAGFAPGPTGVETEGLRWLWQLLLGMQRDAPPFADGSFALPRWDDDFVGSYLPSLERDGACPTVDSTGNSLRALVNLALTLNADALRAPTVTAVRRAASFLLRMQLPEGGWPILRYPNDSPSMPARELSARFALEGLSRAVSGGLLARSDTRRVESAAGRFVSWAKQTGRMDDRGMYWMPNFTRQMASDREIVQSTATIALTLITIVSDLVADPDAEMLLAAATRFLSVAWTPDSRSYGLVAITVPTWEGPAESPIPWEMPTDPLVVSVMLSRSIGNARVIRSLADSLVLARHGHWPDFVMLKEGNYRAMVGNTVHYQDALIRYLLQSRAALDRPPSDS